MHQKHKVTNYCSQGCYGQGKMKKQRSQRLQVHSLSTVGVACRICQAEVKLTMSALFYRRVMLEKMSPSGATPVK